MRLALVAVAAGDRLRCDICRTCLAGATDSLIADANLGGDCAIGFVGTELGSRPGKFNGGENFDLLRLADMTLRAASSFNFAWRTKSAGGGTRDLRGVGELATTATGNEAARGTHSNSGASS